ncbi:transcriptional regulator vib-1 [Niveomyces insectorum RCEF 264]|uniref:Transcriptional regulator vib-1 n=1 Tax=Niveomyces insectorum RCEF 264 TaxID=1081102 RepID=A0A167ZCV9_9HYPO|nr:transcriptional regulator vib-1 [Niveomyces insectorum RCEF 264]
MAAYNPMSALPVGTGNNGDALGLGVTVSHQANAGGLSLGAFDQDLTFDDALLDNVNGLAPLPFTPSYDFETFSATFEDPFPYSAATTGRPYELAPHDPEGFHESASLQDEGLDNKLLGFAAPVAKAAIVDEAGRFTEPAMTAELCGMFFLAEDVYSAENTGRPLELTCYRRNLWWCSGQVTLPRQVTHAVTDHGRHVSILELAASITAVESIEGKATEIICIPWKSTTAANSGGGGTANGNSNSNGTSTSTNTGGGNAQHEEAKIAGAPPNVPIDLANGQELDNGSVSVPISWKRLQFKHATANNGRRKGQQQHYVVQINLLARIKPGSAGLGSGGLGGGMEGGGDEGDEWLKLAEMQSGPVIVRGRSPRNFVSRRDVPLTGSSGAADKKQSQHPHQQQHQHQQHHHQQHQQQQQQQQDRHSLPLNNGLDVSAHPPPQQHRSNSSGGEMAQNFQRYNLLSSMQQPSDWTQAYAQQSPHPTKKIALSPSLTRPPVPAWSNDTPSRIVSKPLHQPPQPQSQRSNSTAVPLNLSLSEDERSPNRAGTDPPSTSPPYAHAKPVSAIALPTISSTVARTTAKNEKTAASAVAQDDNTFDNGELLYEYFPLSLDDWMPPVDAIYRPHVVHHTVIPPEVKAQQVRSKTKRYFAAE